MFYLMLDVMMDLIQWFVNVLMKKSFGGAIKNETISNKELAEELYKPIIIKFQKRKVHSLFIEYICGEDLVDMQLINKLKKRFRFFFNVLLIFIANKSGLFF